jgi:hypothetical protein
MVANPPVPPVATFTNAGLNAPQPAEKRASPKAAAVAAEFIRHDVVGRAAFFALSIRRVSFAYGLVGSLRRCSPGRR